MSETPEARVQEVTTQLRRRLETYSVDVNLNGRNHKGEEMVISRVSRFPDRAQTFGEDDQGRILIAGSTIELSALSYLPDKGNSYTSSFVSVNSDMTPFIDTNFLQVWYTIENALAAGLIV